LTGALSSVAYPAVGCAGVAASVAVAAAMRVWNVDHKPHGYLEPPSRVMDRGMAKEASETARAGRQSHGAAGGEEAAIFQ